ncbi:hypothetical protein GPA27_02390 [Aromatoleum toluolicum]|uniref:Uncharacterized protein n=1 Tax=Aromatoleum toluolicum TaxID=90060 RepID=A0ABX1NAC8_9RHOO|nr:hypothetical protein [Aromatoleum toluolicum]NMF96243.1 hypothetical protein [Aromatoleum toluolicum]
MDSRQARSLIQSLLDLQDASLAAQVLQQNCALLDDGFMQTLNDVIDEQQARRNSYHGFFDTRWSGFVTDHALDQVAAADRTIHYLRLLQDHAGRLRFAAAPEMEADSHTDFEPFSFVCSACGRQMNVICPDCRARGLPDTVALRESGPKCLHCGSRFDRAQCECGAVAVFGEAGDDDVPLDVDEFMVRRDAIMKELWSAQDRAAPEFDSVELAAAGSVAAAALRSLLGEAGHLRESAEIGNTWRYLGDACFCAARKHDQALLTEACNAYRKAEEILAASADERALAKLDFNFANAVRLLDAEDKRKAVDEAIRRYRRALQRFRDLGDEDGAEVTEESLRDMMISYQMADMAHTAQTDRTRIAELRRRLEAGMDDDALLAEAEAETERLKNSLLDDEFRSTLTTLTTHGSETGGDWIANRLLEYDRLAAEIRSESSDRSDEMIGSLGEVLVALLEQTPASSQRRRSFERFAAELDGIRRQRPQSPVARAMRERQLKELLQRLKAVYLEQ